MHRDVFSAGTSHYGVADCELLAQETHKFESRYLDLLIGPYPQDKKTYEERSAINALDGFSAPVMFFQVRGGGGGGGVGFRTWSSCTDCADA